MEYTGEKIKVIPWKESILDEIRERPGMYLGLKSLSALQFFLLGYELGKFRSEHRWPSEVPQHFCDWVAYRLHLRSNWNGFWHRAILSRVRDESLAFDRFYELRDEFARREAKVVATIREDKREYQVQRRDADGHRIDCTEELPRSLSIVVYTEDPGFFFEADGQENFFYRGWFLCALDAWDRPIMDRFNVQDENTWKRLIEENKRYKRNLSRTRARIRDKEKRDS